MASLQITFAKGILSTLWPKTAGGYAIRSVDIDRGRTEIELEPFQTGEDSVTGETVHWAYALPTLVFYEADFGICLAEHGGRLGEHRGEAHLACLTNGDKMQPSEILLALEGALTYDQVRFVTRSTRQALEVRAYRVRLSIVAEVWKWQIQTANGKPGYQNVFLDRSRLPIWQGGAVEIMTAEEFLRPVLGAAVRKTYCSERRLFWAETATPNEAATSH